MGRNPFLISLDQDNDEDGVRARLASAHGYQESVKPLVVEWLREQDEARASASAAMRDVRDERTLAIAEDALSVAKEANRIASLAEASARASSRWAMWAAIIAAISIAITIKDQIVLLVISWLP